MAKPYSPEQLREDLNRIADNRNLFTLLMCMDADVVGPITDDVINSLIKVCHESQADRSYIIMKVEDGLKWEE